jgi:hypothetical protein
MPCTNAFARAAGRRSLSALILIAGPLLACAAHAGPAGLGAQALHGVLGFFADPENVRGVFGAAAGALGSVVAARPLTRRGSGGSDDT